MQKVNLAEKFSQFTDYFNPRIAGELNGQQVKLVKFQGKFVWHHHDNEDELFYVSKGSFEMHLRDKIITINEGEFLIVPVVWSISLLLKKKLQSCFLNLHQQ